MAVHQNNCEIRAVGCVNIGKAQHALIWHGAAFNQPRVIQAARLRQRLPHAGQVAACFHNRQRIGGAHMGN
jgi:hypothetical protein